MTALKYWNGTAWVTIPDNSAKQVWVGPDAPIPLGDNRLWIDTDEPDPMLVGSNSWHSQNYGPATASLAGWRVTPIPTDVNMIKNGDAAAFTRNADGSLTVRDAGVYDIAASISLTTGGGAMIVKGVDESIPNVNYYLTQSGAAGNLVQLAWVGYLPAGQVISLMSYLASATPRQALSFNIARISVGQQGPPGPPGPYMGVPPGQGRVIGIDALDSTGFVTVAALPGLILNGKADNSQPMTLGPITPTYDCIWPVSGSAIAHIGNAAWSRCSLSLCLVTSAFNAMKADADGVNVLSTIIFHNSGIQDYSPGTLNGHFKLVAGQTYGVALAITYTTGTVTWAYHRGGGSNLWISSPGVVPR